MTGVHIYIYLYGRNLGNDICLQRGSDSAGVVLLLELIAVRGKYGLGKWCWLSNVTNGKV